MRKYPVCVLVALTSFIACNKGADTKKDPSATAGASQLPTPGDNTDGSGDKKDDGTSSDKGTDTNSNTNTNTGTNQGTTVAVVGTVALSNSAEVDQAIAFPLSSNAGQQVVSAIKSPVSAGTVALDIPQGGGNLALNGGNFGNGGGPETSSGDWVVALVDSTKTNKLDQIVGFLGLDTGDDSMMKLPIGNTKASSIDFGSIAIQDGNAVSSTTLADEASKFDIQLKMLNEIASTDNVTKSLKNVYANTSADGKTFYQIIPFFVYRDVLMDSPSFNYDAAKNVFLMPTAFNFMPAAVPSGQDCAPSAGDDEPGYGFYFKAADPAHATFDSICSGTKNLALVPPAVLCKRGQGAVAADYLTSFGHVAYTHPATNSAEHECVPQASQTDFYMRGSSGQEGFGFNFGGAGYSGAILPGVWKMNVDSTEVAQFDVSSFSPVDLTDHHPLVYVPAMKVTVDGSNKITKVEAKFYFWNAAKTDTSGMPAPGYDEVTDFTVFNKSVSKIGIAIGDTSGSSAGCAGNAINENGFMTLGTGNTYQYATFQNGPWSFFGDSSQAGTIPTGITIKYEISGMSINFEYRPAHSGC